MDDYMKKTDARYILSLPAQSYTAQSKKRKKKNSHHQALANQIQSQQ